MTQPNEKSNQVATGIIMGRTTNHILIIDDNAKLRAMFTRYTLLEAVERGLSCAIYRLTPSGELQLTFSESANSSTEETAKSIGSTPLNFALYEAASPIHALNWLRTKPIRTLTLVSDVMMPTTDSQLNIGGFVAELADLKLSVNLLFASSEEQNREQVRQLLAPQQPFYFVTKGSATWAQLPQTLIKQRDFFTYQPVKLNSNFS